MPFRIVELSSTRNSLLKAIRQAASRGRPTDEGLLVIEGPHLLQEVARSRWQLEILLFTPETLPSWEPYAREQGVETVLVPARAFSSLAATEATQGVMALARPRHWEWSDLNAGPALVVALDGIQDPGNAGTIVRSAEAFGATGVVLLEHSVRLSNGKFMRASAGSLFRLPVLHSVTRSEFLSRARKAGWRLAALDASGDTDLFSFSFESDCALIVGSEGSGVSPELLSNSTSVTIPASQVESLNAAVACSIALYEASCQRRKHESVRG
jgi:TrmH family RNA methyltransferase